MSVNVAAGQVWIPGQSSANQGMYYALNDATVNLAIAAADPSHPRIDVVYASVQDAAYAGATNLWVLGVQTGTPAPSPSPPAIPVSSIALANVAVAANATSITSGNITDQRVLAQSATGFSTRNTPAGRISISSGFTTTAGSWVLNNLLGTTTYLLGGMTAGSGLLTVPVAGVYACTSTFRTDSGLPLTSLGAGIWHAGSLYGGNNSNLYATAPSASGGTGVTYADTVQCAAGDTLGQAVFSGGNNCLSDTTLPIFTSFSATLVSN